VFIGNAVIILRKLTGINGILARAPDWEVVKARKLKKRPGPVV